VWLGVRRRAVQPGARAGLHSRGGGVRQQGRVPQREPVRDGARRDERAGRRVDALALRRPAGRLHPRRAALPRVAVPPSRANTPASPLISVHIAVYT